MFQFQHCVQNKTSRFARGDIKSDEINIWRYRLITGQDVTDGQTRPFLTRLCTTTQLLMLRPPSLLHALSRSFCILCSSAAVIQIPSAISYLLFLIVWVWVLSPYSGLNKQVVYKHNQDSEAAAAVLGTGNKFQTKVLDCCLIPDSSAMFWKKTSWILWTWTQSGLEGLKQAISFIVMWLIPPSTLASLTHHP